MNDKQSTILEFDKLGAAGPVDALRQVAELFKQVTPVDIQLSSNGSSFHSISEGKDPHSGIVSVCGNLMEDSVILVKVELVRAPAGIRVSSETFFRHLSALGERIHLVPPVLEKESGHTSLWVELKVQAS